VRFLAVASLVLTMTLAAACGGGPSTTERVLVIGDSITASSRDQISQELERYGWQPTIEAEGGTNIEQWASRARALTRFVRPKVVVVELGTNQRGDEAAVGSAIDEVMRGLAGVDTVYWLNVHEHKFTPPQPSAVNTALVSAMTRWPNLHILDFDDYFAARPAWHAPDGLHPSDAGKAAVARFISGALHDVGSPTPSSVPAAP
jgi:lysophospholipase L1-like esterase